MIPYKILFPIVLLLMLVNSINAQQLTANFTATKSSGCSPLNVTFTNTTTGASSAAQYTWDLGNGGSLIPAKDITETETTTYTTTNTTYIVTLTVKDGNSISEKKDTIVVYSNPIPSFTVKDSVGCTPLKISFVSTSTDVSGKVNYFSYDFADGHGYTGDSNIVSHTYTSSGKWTVKLSVTSSKGCSSDTSFEKKDLINALLTPTALFSKNKTYLCATGDSVSFTNNSTNLQQSTYKWIFGDGAVSSDSVTTHTYNTKGVFTDSLIVTNADGCTNVATASVYSALFTSNFSATGLCAKDSIHFINTSVPKPDSSSWNFGNLSYPISGVDVLNAFNFPGKYNVEVINHFGTCSDTLKNDTILINPAVYLLGFTISTAPQCGQKSLINLIDTSAGSVAWLWSIKGIKDTLTTDTAQFLLRDNFTYNITLTTKKASGCRASQTLPLKLLRTPVTILSLIGDSLKSSSGCQGMTVTFSATPPIGIKNYSWDFGDNSAPSSDSAPIHQYNAKGTFNVRLIYTTVDGCSDTIATTIKTFERPIVTFYTPDTVNCGSKAYFYNTTKTKTTEWFWYFSDTALISNLQNPVHAFRDTGTFSVKLVAYNGTCYDSAVYINYIRVLAPLLHIDTIAYTCNGNRDTANFLVTNAYVQGKLKLTFGDGDSAIFNPKRGIDTITHRYLGGTGTYRSVLSGTNGGCTVRDTDWVHILTPQFPKITSKGITSICENDTIKLFIDTLTLAVNPGVSDYNYYTFAQWQYGGATNVPNSFFSQPGDWYHTYFGMLSGLMPGQTQIRAILQSGYFGCYDTTKYLPLKIKGPIVNYSIVNPMNCFKQPISFKDASKTNFGVPLAKWEWNFGDSTFDTLTVNGNIKHTYKSPGIYETYLKVIDADGCFGINSVPDSALPAGPKAGFYWNPAHIIAGTSSNFIDTSNTFENGNNVIYKWSFANSGITSTNADSIRVFYPGPQTDVVSLIASDTITGCTDTATTFVPVKKIFALFDYTSHYGPNGCAPVTDSFFSHSLDASRIVWDFGDGSPTVPNDTIVSHQYNPGVYNVKLIAYGKNNSIQDSTIETVVVKGAYGIAKTNVSMACVPATITLTSQQTNAVSYYWDYGDGKKQDTLSKHLYTLIGNFVPRLVLTDKNNCSSSYTAKPVLIDSIHASFKTDLNPICDSATVQFTPKIWSYAHDSLGYPLTYQWSFGAVKSILSNPTFYYNKLGTYPINEKVTSVAGCSYSFDSTIVVVRSVRATIAGPAKVCDSVPIYFAGIINTADSIKWKWYFDNGVTSSRQNPDSIYYTTPTDVVSNKNATLVTTFNGCNDTTTVSIVVNPIPMVNLQPRDTAICVGQPITLVAHDGIKYQWSPIGLTTTSASITRKLDSTRIHTVTVTNSYKCTSTDTTMVFVRQHLPLQYHDLNVCAGKTLQLPVSGTDNLVWTPDPTLTNTVSSPLSPTAAPVANPTVYSFKAKDNYGCFDSVPGSISVAIQPYPSIGTDSALRIFTGDSVLLKTYSSSDVISYAWTATTADTYLGCDSCPMPYAMPRTNVAYTVTATTKYGCASTAGVTVTIICSKSLYFPNAFTPDASSNRIFFPTGKGIKTITRFQVFNRGGKLLYSANNMPVGAGYMGFGWNGNVNGLQQPTGTYVYTAEAVCDTGQTFPMSGTVVLIR